MISKSSKETVKINFFLIIIIGLTIFACFSVGYYFNSEPENNDELVYKKMIKNEFDIILPDECKLIYAIKDNRGTYREADPTYCVFEFAEEPTDFFEKNNFKNERNEEFEERVQRIFNFQVKDSEWNVPPKYLPRFSLNYRYSGFEKNSGFIVYHTNYKYLYVYLPGDY